MATFKYIISPYKKSDGTRNVTICVFHNDKKRYPTTNFYLSSADLTKSLKIRNQMYIDLLDDILRKCRNRCNEYAAVLGSMDIDKVVSLVADIISGKEQNQNAFDLDFIKYGREVIMQLKKAGKTGNARTYEVALNNLVKFIGRETLSISEITSSFIQKWIDWIKSTSAGGRKESLYPSNIRALHNRAKNEFNEEDIGLIRIPLSPFKKVKLPSLPEKRERALAVEQIRQIFYLPDKTQYQTGTNRYNFARDMFMLSFLLVGINEVDLFNCTDIANGRITYRRTKVKNRRADKGKISIKIEPEAKALIEKYRDKTGKRVFCFYQMYKNENTFTGAINGNSINKSGLKRIGQKLGIEDLEFYAARHSWATIARNDCKIDKYTIHEALNHVDNLKITDDYIKKDWSIIDSANRTVIDYVLNQ
ncbi:MAG: site-specific integrase [Paludibacter sp.]|nr:site-specific integrase [Paludibacter sp.]